MTNVIIGFSIYVIWIPEYVYVECDVGLYRNRHISYINTPSHIDIFQIVHISKLGTIKLKEIIKKIEKGTLCAFKNVIVAFNAMIGWGMVFGKIVSHVVNTFIPFYVKLLLCCLIT